MSKCQDCGAKNAVGCQGDTILCMKCDTKRFGMRTGTHTVKHGLMSTTTYPKESIDLDTAAIHNAVKQPTDSKRQVHNQANSLGSQSVQLNADKPSITMEHIMAAIESHRRDTAEMRNEIQQLREGNQDEKHKDSKFGMPRRFA